VSETSFKFFIQFLLYGSLFALYNVITLAVFVAELRDQVSTDNPSSSLSAFNCMARCLTIYFRAFYAAGTGGCSFHFDSCSV
jgi:hypothetical protein